VRGAIVSPVATGGGMAAGLCGSGSRRHHACWWVQGGTLLRQGGYGGVAGAWAFVAAAVRDAGAGAEDLLDAFSKEPLRQLPSIRKWEGGAERARGISRMHSQTERDPSPSAAICPKSEHRGSAFSITAATTCAPSVRPIGPTCCSLTLHGGPCGAPRHCLTRHFSSDMRAVTRCSSYPTGRGVR
jgi:hypothetical protein